MAQQNHPLTKLTGLNSKHITTCALLSSACYVDNPVEMFDSHFKNYELGVEHVATCDPNNVSHHFLVGISKVNKTIYIAFRGTDNAQDILQDLKFIQLPGTDFEGNFHKGFFDRANWMRIELFLKCLEEDYKIICCGHSLGGSVAAIVALRLMKSPNNSNKGRDNIFVVGFGAPMFGCKLVKEMVDNDRHKKQFVWFLNENDIVPASLFLVQRIFNGKKNSGISGGERQGGGFNLDMVLKMFKTWNKTEDESIFSICKSVLEKVGSLITWEGISEMVEGFIKNSLNLSESNAKMFVIVWKVLQTISLQLGKTIFEVGKKLLKESQYAMIGVFFLVKHGSITEYNEDHFLPIDETVSNIQEITNCFN